MVVASDLEQRASLQDLLESGGHAVVHYADAEQALAAMEASHPDLVIASLSTPHLEGWTLCRLMRSPEHADLDAVPVLIVSAHFTGEEAARITVDLGGNGLLPSSTGQERLLFEVDMLLDRAAGAAPAVESRQSGATEKRFHEAVKDAGAGYFFIDTESRFRWVNDAWLRLHGYSRLEEVVGRHFSITQVDSALKRADRIVRDLLSGLPVPSMEFSRKRKDGSVGYHMFSAHPVMDGSRVVGLEGFLIDTTAVHEAEARYQMLFRRMPDGFALHEMIFDAEGRPADYRFLTVNPAFERMTGLKAQDITGKTAWEALPGTEPKWIETYGKVTLTGESASFEDYAAELGKYFEVTAFRTASNQFASILVDVTARKRAEEALRESEVRFRSITEQTSDLVALTDVNGFVTYASPASRALFHLAPEEMCGRHFMEFLDEAVIPKAAEAFRDAMERGERMKDLELTIKRADGSVFVGELNGSSFRCGTQNGTLAVIRDITERKRAAAELERVNRTVSMALAAGKAGAWELNLETGELLWTNEYRQLLGLEPNFVPTIDGFLALVHPEDRAFIKAAIEKTTEEFSSFRNQFRAVLADGIHWLERRGSVQHDAAGRAVRVIGITCDITQHKRAEEERRIRMEELIDSEAKHRQLYEGMIDGFVSVDMAGRFVEFNEAYREMLGYEREELRDLTYIDLSPEKWRGIEADIVANQVLRRGYSDIYDKEYQRKDGTVFPVELRMILLKNAKGEPAGMWGFVRDITYRKLAEAKLRQSEERLRLTLDAANMVAWEINPVDGTHHEAGPVDRLFGRATGFAHAELGDLAASIHPADRDRVLGTIAAARRGECDYSVEYRILLQDGGEKWIAANGNLLRDAQGRPQRLLGVACDITERKQAEIRLRESQAALAAAQRIAQIGSWQWNLVTNEADWSDETFRIFAPVPDRLEQHGDRFLEMVHADDRPRVIQALTDAFNGTAEYDLEYRILRPDGAERVIHAQGEVLRDETGKPTIMRGTVHNITERRRADQTLRESEQRYRSLFENMLEGFAYCRILFEDGLPQDFVYLEVNNAFQTLTGLKDVRGKKVSEVIPGIREADPELFERYARVVSTGRPERCEFYVTAMKAWFDLSVYSLGQEYFVVVFDVITKRKRTEEALWQTNLRLHLAAASGGLGIWEWDIQSDRLVWDDRMFELYGVARDQFSGCYEAWRSALHPDDRARATEAIEGAISREQQYDLEFRVVHPDGAVKHIKADGLVTRGAGGRAVRMIGLNRDITAAKLAAEERETLHAQLTQAQKMESIGRLAGGVAHDFNNLLTIINGYSFVLMRGLKEGDPMGNSLRQIHKAGERAAQLTRQLLAFSRKQITDPRPVDLNGMITETREMLERLVGEDIEVVTQLAPELGYVMADPGNLHQVLMNLAVNARDAMPDGGRLTIKTANADLDKPHAGGRQEGEPGPFIRLTVSDTGIGMNEEIQRRIFEPFFTTKGEGEGTGLGLSTVYGIVKQSGGSIMVHSEPGRGATFIIDLRRIEAAEAPSAEAATSSVALRGTETVLVVEDQADVRGLAVMVLKSHGYRILEAANGGEALLSAERYVGAIHLMLTDVLMPGMTGKELVERLKPLRPEMKVLYMSGYAADVVTRRGLLGPGMLYLAKPFAPDTLAAKVREVLGPAREIATILVVDDEAEVRDFFREVLAGAGYDVLLAKDGKEALTIARSRTVRLILTDLVMPEQEGIETIQALRRVGSGVGIVAISGALGGQFLKIAQMLGADAVLSKPVSPELLLARVAEVLQSRR